MRNLTYLFIGATLLFCYPINAQDVVHYGNNSGTKGKGSTFIGASSGTSTTDEGKNNSFLGLGSGMYNTSGTENCFFGAMTGNFNVSGSRNTYLGTFAGFKPGAPTQPTSGNVFIGYYAGYQETGSNKLHISNTSTNKPLIYGEFDNKILQINGKLKAGQINSSEYTEIGHGGIHSYINAVGDGNLDFRHDDNTKMSLTPDGYLGIGTRTPKRKLHVNGDYYGKGHVFLHALEGDGASGAAYIQARDDSQNSNISLQLRTQDNGKVVDALRINYKGQVGIGIPENNMGTHKLAVEGSIGAREVVVQASGWADFVFDQSYTLKELEEVEEYISQNKHLPDVPSASDVEKNGISLGEMDAILLQKIEELTLYLIELKKDNNELRSLIDN